jgi:hypothetical protein
MISSVQSQARLVPSVRALLLRGGETRPARPSVPYRGGDYSEVLSIIGFERLGWWDRKVVVTRHSPVYPPNDAVVQRHSPFIHQMTPWCKTTLCPFVRVSCTCACRMARPK